MTIGIQWCKWCRTPRCKLCTAVEHQWRIQDFGQGGLSRVLTSEGGQEPKHLLNITVFPLKLPENCMILNILGSKRPPNKEPGLCGQGARSREKEHRKGLWLSFAEFPKQEILIIASADS